MTVKNNPNPKTTLKFTAVNSAKHSDCALFESEWNTGSCFVIRLMIVIANCVLGRIFETREREEKPWIVC